MDFGTFNTHHGLKKILHNDNSLSLDLTSLFQDVNKHKIDVLAIQETHLQEFEYKQKEKGYIAYCVNDKGNNDHGAGIVIKEKYKPSFRRISARVCTASFKLDNEKHILFISGYAPH